MPTPRPGRPWLAPLAAATLVLLVFASSAGRAPSDAFHSRLAHGREIATHGLGQASRAPQFIGGGPWRAPGWAFDLAVHLAARLVGVSPVAAAVRALAMVAFYAAVAAAAGTAVALPAALAALVVCDLAALPEPAFVPLGLIALLLSLEARGASARWLLALIALWANLDGSFVIALLLVATAPGLAWRTRLGRAAAAAAAVLLNPRGPLVYDPRGFWPSRALIAVCPDWRPLDFREGAPMLVAAFLAATALLAVFARDRLGRGRRLLWILSFLAVIATRAWLPVFIALSAAVYGTIALATRRARVGAALATATVLLAGTILRPEIATPDLPSAGVAALAADTAVLHPIGLGGRLLGLAPALRVFPACEPGVGSDERRALQAALLRPAADAWSSPGIQSTPCSRRGAGHCGPT